MQIFVDFCKAPKYKNKNNDSMPYAKKRTNEVGCLTYQCCVNQLIIYR